MSEALDVNNSKNESNQQNKNESELIKTDEKEIKQDQEIVNWRDQCIRGNLMPGIMMLEQKKLDINDEISPENGNTLLHYAANYGFYNVIRALIEIYHADVNKQNKFGYTPIYYIVSNTEINLFNFQYLIKIENIDYNIEDNNGLNLLVHSIITKFHYAFLYFAHLGLIENHKNDKFGNPLIYFAIVNENKFALSYLLCNNKCNINDGYYNNTSVLSDILITNKNTSITKFLAKYFNEQINLSSIHTCKKNILNFPFYNVYNYELLNTLYFYKRKSYSKFIGALLKKFSPKFGRISNQRLLEDDLVNDQIGYKYKMINLKFMIYDLILPNLSKGTKVILFLLYTICLYLLTTRSLIFKVFVNNETIDLFSLIYKIISIFILYIWFIYMFNSSDNTLNSTGELESGIANIIKNDNVVNLPYIDEICVACGSRKKLCDSHCYRCKGCFRNRFFHSNLFNICITKYNIKRYMFYLFLKINFYLICLYNCLEKNPTKKSILAFFYMFRYKTDLFNAICQFIIGFMMFKEIGHFVALLLSLTVKTPYQYIYKYHKKVYPLTLKEKNDNNMIVQSPEINDYIPFKIAAKNILNNIC